MFKLAYAFYYKLVRQSKDKDPGRRHEFILRERPIFISAGVGGGGGWGVGCGGGWGWGVGGLGGTQLINNDRSLN